MLQTRHWYNPHALSQQYDIYTTNLNLNSQMKAFHSRPLFGDDFIQRCYIVQSNASKILPYTKKYTLSHHLLAVI